MSRIILLLSLSFFISIHNIESQNKNYNSWTIEFNENVHRPLNDIEIKYILEAYGESTYKRILNINPLLLNIKDILRNRVEILKKKYYKNEEIKKLSLVKKTNSNPIFDINDFNPLLYDFDFESKKNQIYRVDNTDYLINILPRKYK